MRHQELRPCIPNSVAQLISYHRPESAVFYRLQDLAGTLHPLPNERAYRCLPSLDVPYVPAGRYLICYYDRDSQEVEIVGGSAPEIVVDAQYGTLKTPGDLEEEEDTRLQRIERREQRNRREAAMTQSVEKTTQLMEKLSLTVAETNERHSRTIAELNDKYTAQVIEREGAMLQTIKSVLEVVQQHTRGASEAGAQQIKLIDHLVDKARSSHDWPGVVREVVVQLGTLAQTFAPRESAIRDGKPRIAPPTDTPPKLPAGASRELPARSDAPALASGSPPARTGPPAPKTSESAPPVSESAPKTSESAPEDSHESWIDRLFGWSEPAPKAAQPVAHAEPAPVSEPVPAVPEDAPKSAAEEPRTSAQTHEGEPTTALVPIDLGAVLEQLLAQATATPAPPRPAEWSRSWAFKEAKRRVVALGEAGFLWTVTQPRRLLAFLKDLVAAIRPPPADDFDGLCPAEGLP